jgi:hypothetical protein
MEIDPMNAVDSNGTTDRAASATLNTWVALVVALLVTFTGICKVKDDNIVQAMQQAQADKLDHWAFYQARNIREEIGKATVATIELTPVPAAGPMRAARESILNHYRALVADQVAKKDSLKQQAEADQATYDSLNFRDDQFDLSDALVALAISMLALTALTKKRWLFWVALVPTAFGILMGLAGLMGWHLHPDAITKMLS